MVCVTAFLYPPSRHSTTTPQPRTKHDTELTHGGRSKFFSISVCPET
jgi:hypothetical protein